MVNKEELQIFNAYAVIFDHTYKIQHTLFKFFPNDEDVSSERHDESSLLSFLWYFSKGVLRSVIGSDVLVITYRVYIISQRLRQNMYPGYHYPTN